MADVVVSVDAGSGGVNAILATGKEFAKRNNGLNATLELTATRMSFTSS
jgi:hypothetical protein